MKIFLTLTIRNFLKSKGLNGLNVLGLSMGIIAALLIIVYSEHEFSYDSFHEDAQNIYRLEGKTNGDQWFSNLGMEHGRELTSGKYPEVKGKVQLNAGQKAFLSYKDRKFAEKGIYRTSPGSDFFGLFNFKILEGNKESLLDEPYAVVLTKSAAEKYSGT